MFPYKPRSFTLMKTGRSRSHDPLRPRSGYGNFVLRLAVYLQVVPLIANDVGIALVLLFQVPVKPKPE